MGSGEASKQLGDVAEPRAKDWLSFRAYCQSTLTHEQRSGSLNAKECSSADRKSVTDLGNGDEDSGLKRIHRISCLCFSSSPNTIRGPLHIPLLPQNLLKTQFNQVKMET